MEKKITIKKDDESLGTHRKNRPETDLNNKAIKTIVELLKSENISYIIYIDDKFDIEGQREEFIGRVKGFKAQGNKIQDEEFENFNWEGPDELINKLWDDSKNKSQLLKCVFKESREEETANVKPTLEINQHFGDNIKTFTPDQWIESEFKLISDLERGKKALCLFDFEFQRGNEKFKGRNGVELARIILEKKDLRDKIICGIFSSKFSEEEEDAKRDSFAREFNVDKNLFYTVSKFRYQYDPLISGFSEGIKILLLQPYVEVLRKESKDVLSSSNKKAWEKIDEITPKTFNQIIQKSSLKEGVWEISTLFRLYSILIAEENFNIISNIEVRKRFNSYIEKIRLIDKTETGYVSNVPNQQLMDLRNSELYIKGELVNKLHLPISNGDIFKIKGKFYVLLVQPCNLALRAKDTECGSRSKNYNNAFLIPLKEFSKEQLNHTKQEVLSPTNSPENVLCAYFPEFKVISLDYLDLTVFNETGESYINLTIPELDNDVIHFPWKKRYSHILEKLSALEEKIKSFIYIKSLINPKIEELSSTIRELIKDLSILNPEEKTKVLKELSPIKKEKKFLEDHLKVLEESIYSIENFDSFNLNTIDNYCPKNRTFCFNIRREKHYKPPYSDDLLQKFMLYLSRNAFEHDFTN